MRHRSATRAAILLVAFLLLSGCGVGDRTQIVAIINANPAHEVTVETFVAELAAAGWEDGDRIEIVYNGAVTGAEATLAEAEQLLQLDPAIVVAVPSDAAAVVGALTDETPILFLAAPDPVAQGLVDSLSSPGGNLTGVNVGGFISKQVELALELVPNAQRVVVPHDSDSTAGQAAYATAASALDAFGLTPTEVEVTSDDDIPALAEAMVGADLVLLVPGTPITRNAVAIAEAGIAAGVPVFAYSDLHARGALASYGAVREDFARAAVPLAIRLLEGEAPESIPVVTVDFGLRLNESTAQAIGFEFSSVLRSTAVDVLP